MRDTLYDDMLLVGFDIDPLEKDNPAICIMRKDDNGTKIVKMKVGEQAEILYRLITEQGLEAAIKEEV